MRRMGGLDAAFLYGETPSWHMHVSAVQLADPSTAPGGFSFDRLKELVVARLPQVPQFRWRLVEAPLGLGRPGWVEERDFDPDYHIRRIGCPAPGGRHELGELVGDLVSYKLDRRKPLWEMWVIEGLEDDRVAILTKVHHAIIDGVSGADLATVLMDMQPEPAVPPADASVDSLEHERMPGGVELLARGVVHTMFTPWRAMRYAGQLAGSALTFAGFMRRDDAPKIPFQAPRTSLNAAITPHRRFANSTVPLASVKQVKDAFGMKLNDVVLALCAGALRNYLESLGELPDAPLIAQVPVSQRTDADRGEVGNKVAAMFASLATHIEDPGERLREIHDSTQSAKEMQQALAAKRIMGLTDTTPPGLISLAARTYTAMGLDGRTPPIFNVIISNVPGPPFPLYIGGARLISMAPMGPLLYGGGLNITVLSYMDRLDFGFLSCREAVPDPWLIADGIPLALEELEKAASDLA